MNKGEFSMSSPFHFWITPSVLTPLPKSGKKEQRHSQENEGGFPTLSN
jgi:hypothetical protein